MSSVLPPKPKKIEKTIEQLEFKRKDPYAWIKDENWQEVLTNPSCLKDDIKSYLEQENEYTNNIMASTAALQEKLFLSMKEKLVNKETSPELPDGDWIYYSRFNDQQEYKCYYRKSVQNYKEHLLFDPNEEAHQYNYYKIASMTHSPDHKLLAYVEDTKGSEAWQIRIKNLHTDEILPQIILPCSGSFTFSPCSQYLFWIYRDNQGRPTKIYRHHLKSMQDVLIYEEKNPGFFLNIEKSLSNQWIYITANNHDTSEVWLISADTPTVDPICFRKRKENVFYKLIDWDKQFIIYTNENNAYNFKLMRVTIPDQLTLENFDHKYWQEWIKHNPTHYLIEIYAYRNFFLRLERHNVNTQIVITTLDQQEILITGDEEAYVLSLDENLDYNSNWLRYSYQSPTTPRCWYRYHVPTGKKEIIKQQQMPSYFDSKIYQTKRIWTTAKDGNQIPLTLTYRKDIEFNGKTPVLLYGYGAYGYAIDPIFSISALNYIDRGWIYAIAHIRGGSEKGWEWFLNGRKFNKTNSFNDFISCADFLVKQHYTQPKMIVAEGRSAGGMIMGYIANERPDLFAAIIAVVPFVDILNTMSDITLPLTPPEWPEWGNPIKDKHAYKYIASYSPYDNIKKQAYPSILAMGGLTDPRVTYWEPAKWIAKLRDYTLSKNLLLLKINMDSGHAGSAGRYASLKDTAFIQAFALSVLKAKI